MRTWWACALCVLSCGAQAGVLDAFDSPQGWKIIQSDQVTGVLRNADGGLCLDYDFHGVSGYVGLQRDIALDYPDNYAFAFRTRGEGAKNDFQFKLVDASGDNVWWATKPKFAFPSEWSEMRFKKRHISKAWGPSEDKDLKHSAKLEFTLASGEGGKGSACFDALTFDALAAPDTSAFTTSTTRNGPYDYTYDLGTVREFGGFILGDRVAKVELSSDRKHWRAVRDPLYMERADNTSFVSLPEAEARYIRAQVKPADAGNLREGAPPRIEVQPLAFSATPNDFLKTVASKSPRGEFPRGFVGEQPYWTIVGVDGGKDQGLIGEDGAIELGKGTFSIVPTLQVENDRRYTWADVELRQSLRDAYLPMPTVQWKTHDVTLDVSAFASGTPDHARLIARYELKNPSPLPRRVTLVLNVQPFQVNPPSQFLNTMGGFAPIHAVALQGDRLMVDDTARLALSRAPSARHSWGSKDPGGLARGALAYAFDLAPGATWEVAWAAPLGGGPVEPVSIAEATRLQAEVAAQWHDKLDRVKITVPPQGAHLTNTLRTALAHMAISRVGPRLQPGTRSYSRAWIRDGAMIGEGLLRLGREDIAKDFLRWYAPYQFDSGKVPCCVDDRGADPVPENDSHGELIYLVAEVYRYTRDRALLEQMWPHVQGAVKYMDELRASERTEKNRAKDPAFYGLMPASISHEGYSAKPMHSYWDDFWALRGYKDAVEIAKWLGKTDDEQRFVASRDQFSNDLQASLRTAMAQKQIDFIPGSAELGDFDATSTTIALAPGAADVVLPPGALEKTFERYWREFEQRRDGTKAWKDYTPYELRTVGTFVRLGWRDRVQAALDFFFDDQQPRAWNQWAEVVSRTPRTPFFVGDLPHAWVASDYVRSALDMFAYERPGDEAIVIAAGIPADWLKGEGIAIEGLRTPGGALSYSVREVGDKLVLRVRGGIELPKGGLVFPWNGKETRVTRVPAKVEIPR